MTPRSFSGRWKKKIDVPEPLYPPRFDSDEFGHRALCTCTLTSYWTTGVRHSRAEAEGELARHLTGHHDRRLEVDPPDDVRDVVLDLMDAVGRIAKHQFQGKDDLAGLCDAAIALHRIAAAHNIDLDSGVAYRHAVLSARERGDTAVAP